MSKLKAIGTRLSPDEIEKIKLLSRVRGATFGEALSVMIRNYSFSKAETLALAALDKVNLERSMHPPAS